MNSVILLITLTESASPPDPGCGLVFKTLQTINRFIVRPVTPDELAESLHEKQELPPVRLKTQSYSLRLE